MRWERRTYKDGTITWKKGGVKIGLYKYPLGWKLSVNMKDYSFPDYDYPKYINVDENYTVANFKSKRKALEYAIKYMRKLNW